MLACLREMLSFEVARHSENASFKQQKLWSVYIVTMDVLGCIKGSGLLLKSACSGR